METYLQAKGWLTEGERKFLYETAKHFGQYANILNIGVEFGASIACLCEGNPSVWASITGVDINNSKYAGPAYKNLKLVTADSLEFLEVYPSSDRYKYHFAFVDGNHTYEHVIQEARLLESRIILGGILAFHDCYSWEAPGQVHAICPGVNQAVSEWFGTMGHKFEELPYVDSIRVFRCKS